MVYSKQGIFNYHFDWSQAGSKLTHLANDPGLKPSAALDLLTNLPYFFPFPILKPKLIVQMSHQLMSGME